MSRIRYRGTRIGFVQDVSVHGPPGAPLSFDWVRNQKPIELMGAQPWDVAHGLTLATTLGPVLGALGFELPPPQPSHVVNHRPAAVSIPPHLALPPMRANPHPMMASLLLRHGKGRRLRSIAAGNRDTAHPASSDRSRECE